MRSGSSAVGVLGNAIPSVRAWSVIVWETEQVYTRLHNMLAVMIASATICALLKLLYRTNIAGFCGGLCDSLSRNACCVSSLCYGKCCGLFDV